MTEILIAGFVGAISASIFVLYYNHAIQQKSLRSTTTIDTISWADDIYDRLMTIHAQRDSTFTGAPFGLSNDEYRTVVKEAKAMLLASKNRAKVALTYGDGPVLMKFDALHSEFVEITETLLKADAQTWSEVNAKISERFSNVVEPLIKSVESMLITGARFPVINRALFAPKSPVLYFPHQEKDIDLHKTGQSSGDAIKSFAAWNMGKFIETIYDAVRLIIFLGLIAFGVWMFYGKPDLMWLFSGSPGPDTHQTPSLPVLVLPEICVESPRDYGLVAAGDLAPLANGTALIFRSQEAVLRLQMKNTRSDDLVNVVFMLSLPKELMTVADSEWKPSWKELETRTGNWLILNLKDDIKAGTSQSLSPFAMVRFPAPGEYRIPYKYFADNLQPQNGFFVLKFVE